MNRGYWLDASRQSLQCLEKVTQSKLIVSMLQRNLIMKVAEVGRCIGAFNLSFLNLGEILTMVLPALKCQHALSKMYSLHYEADLILRILHSPYLAITLRVDL